MELRNELRSALDTIKWLSYQFSDGLDDMTRMNIGRQTESIEMVLAIADGKPYLKELDVPDKEPMYITRSQSGQTYEMRQMRYKDLLTSGREHPHDLCAVSVSIEQMHTMIDKWWPDADYSAVES